MMRKQKIDIEPNLYDCEDVYNYIRNGQMTGEEFKTWIEYELTHSYNNGMEWAYNELNKSLSNNNGMEWLYNELNKSL